MKKELLIKQIASEFNVDEIKVSDYFDCIFETLAAAFIKNKNVNISEFGKFSVKNKKDENGEQKKTVLFSPVRKFAEGINYNFNELKPVQIRLLDSAASAEYATDDFVEDTEEILLIDFEGDISSAPDPQEVLIHEDSESETPVLESEKPEEKILIPEADKPEMPTLKTEVKKEEILIHEILPAEINTETIFEEIKEEVKTKPQADLKSESVFKDKTRILDELKSVKFPVRIFDLTEPEKKELSSAAKTISHDATIYVKDEKSDDKKPAIDKIEEEIEQLKAFIKEEKPEDEIAEEPKQNIFAEETKEEILQEPVKEELPKTSLELEAELLQMLEERKKILEEISRLEKSDQDDVVDISGPKITGDEEKPKLHDESTLDHPKQNIFADEEGKILEELLGLISGEGETDHTEQEKTTSEQKEEASENIFSEEKDELKPEEETGQGEHLSEQVTETTNADNLFENLFGKPSEEQETSETEEIKQQSFNAEMKVFDRLLDEPITPETDGQPEKDENGLTSFSELEKMFRSFKTETDEEKTANENIVEEKPVESGPDVIQEKTETIKTYDDITNLLGTNGGKKEKQEDILQESPKKKITPAARMTIIMLTILIAIIIFVVLYQKFVNKPSEQNMQIPVPHPADSTKVAGSDSVIYADTNKTAEQEESEIVFEKDDKVIKETAKGFYIEFGEYENQFTLAKEIKTLKDNGITPGYEEVKTEGKTYYKMKLGPYNSLKEAKSILSKLSKL